jgi:hypothetical protein
MLLVVLLALPAVAHAAPRARFQDAACPCERCVTDLHNSIADCESLGLDCGCLLDCKCQQCVVAMGNSVAGCESLGLDCSCYHAAPSGGGGGGGGGGACADFDDRTQALNDECCGEVTEDCSSGRPAVCNVGCAHVLLPYFDDCGDALGADGVAVFADVIALCHAAEVAEGADTTSSSGPGCFSMKDEATCTNEVYDLPDGTVGQCVWSGGLCSTGGASAVAAPCEGAACKGCSAMAGSHLYAGWSVTCSDLGGNVDCDGCRGGDVPSTQRDKCPHGCICTVTCDGFRGYEENALVVGEDSLYAVNCNDGQWAGETGCSPGSPQCTDLNGHAASLCKDVDDCASSPCSNGGDCRDALKNYTCACHPGFSGQDCAIDNEDECTEGFIDVHGVAIPGNPCHLETIVSPCQRQRQPALKWRLQLDP